MKRLISLSLAAAIVLMASGAAMAQQQQRQRQRGGFGGFGGGQSALLSQKSVQEDLKLSEDQIKKVKELSDKQREARQGLRDLSQEERRTKMQELAKANEKGVAEILNPTQSKRIKQISLQTRGGSALANEDVAKELKLTEEQKEKVKALLPQRGAGAGQGGQRRQLDDEARKKLAEERKARNEKLLNILTTEQKAKWKEMTGEPFKGEITFGGGRGRGTP